MCESDIEYQYGLYSGDEYLGPVKNFEAAKIGVTFLRKNGFTPAVRVVDLETGEIRIEYAKDELPMNDITNIQEYKVSEIVDRLIESLHFGASFHFIHCGKEHDVWLSEKDDGSYSIRHSVSDGNEFLYDFGMTSIFRLIALWYTDSYDSCFYGSREWFHIDNQQLHDALLNIGTDALEEVGVL